MLKIDDELKNNNLSRFHLLFGEEYYRVILYRKKLVAALSNEGDDMNTLVLSDKEVDEDSIADFGNLAPFMAERRLLVIEESGYFSSAGERKELKAVLENLPETTYVIFVEKEVSKKVSMYKWMQKQEKEGRGLVSEFAPLQGKELEGWIGAYLARAGKKVTRGAVRDLIDRLGSDMMLLRSEMDKLIGYVGDADAIREDDVDAICSGVIVSKIFAMVNAVSAGNSKQALSLYRDLIYNKENPLFILDRLGKEFLSIYRAKTSENLVGSDRDIALKLGMTANQAWKVNDVRALARRFDTEKLERIMRLWAKTDEDIKTSDVDRQVAVEIFLISSLTN